MEHRAASRHHVGFGIVFALVAMALSFLAVLVLSSNAQIGSAAQAQYAGAASDGCATTSDVQTFTGTQNQTTDPFRITSDSFRLAVNTTGGGRLEVSVLNEQGQQTGQGFEVSGNGSKVIPLGPGTFRLRLVEKNNLSRYSVTVEECRDDSASNVNTNQTTTPITTAQTTTPTTTADAEAQTADGVNSEADAFRCDFFLHVVRDEQGGVRDQYRDDELIVRRFEQCLSEDVLTDTIPNRRLPGTGGPALLGLAALGLASLVAGASVLRAGTRRRR